jgi:hypothetical protein
MVCIFKPHITDKCSIDGYEIFTASPVGVGIRDSRGTRRGMTGVGSVADIVQLPDAEISTDNATSSPTTTSSGSACPSTALVALWLRAIMGDFS